LKIGDFGLLRSRDSTKRLKEGDGNYISPELLSSDSPEDIDDKADIYSLGVTFYEMVTNFKVDHVVWQQIRDGDLVLSRMSDDLAKLLQKMLSLVPTVRPSASEILHLDRIRKAATAYKITLPSNSSEYSDHLSTDIPIDDSVNSGNSTNSDASGEGEHFVNKENLPTSPLRPAVLPQEMAVVKRKLF